MKLHDTTITGIKWFGTFMFLAAAIILSANVEGSRYGFFLFLIGHAILSVLFWKVNDRALFTQNFGFLFIDLFGIYRWFLS